MVTLNDYLYNGDTIFKILHLYSEDLKNEAVKNHNGIDMLHCEFLMQITDMLEHNDFLTEQSHKFRDFYKLLAIKFPFLAFTVKGRIKSLIRAEEKFNGYIVEYCVEKYTRTGEFPTVEELKPKLKHFRDLIAYRIVISMPKRYLKNDEAREQVELNYLYDIANMLPDFLTERGFEPETTDGENESTSIVLREDIRPYYRDYITSNLKSDYESLHITFFDKTSKSYIEVQLRTKAMDDYAEIGPANHMAYEEKQNQKRTNQADIPTGVCPFFDEALERFNLLRDLDLSMLDVNMFAAVNNSLINDGCGLYRGRQILPFEHLSRFQNDMV